MTFFQALVLGVVQGLTEFLPVSSSAHLIIFQNFFQLRGPILLVFDVVVHLGTLLAIFVYFWKEFFPWPKWEKKMWLLIIIGTIPTGIIGLALNDWMEANFNVLWITSVTLLLNSLILWSVKWAPVNRKEGMSLRDSFWIGVAQGISILPGISRSGATVATGLWLKIKPEEAVRFSFFVGIPAILAAALVVFPEAASEVKPDMWPTMITGFVSAFVSGYFAIAVLFKIVLKGRFHDFALYTFLLAILSFIFLR